MLNHFLVTFEFLREILTFCRTCWRLLNRAPASHLRPRFDWRPMTVARRRHSSSLNPSFSCSSSLSSITCVQLMVSSPKLAFSTAIDCIGSARSVFRIFVCCLALLPVKGGNLFECRSLLFPNRIVSKLFVCFIPLPEIRWLLFDPFWLLSELLRLHRFSCPLCGAMRQRHKFRWQRLQTKDLQLFILCSCFFFWWWNGSRPRLSERTASSSLYIPLMTEDDSSSSATVLCTEWIQTHWFSACSADWNNEARVS